MLHTGSFYKVSYSNNQLMGFHLQELVCSNSSKILAQWIYRSINAGLNLLSTSQTALTKCKSAEFELSLFKPYKPILDDV